MKKPTISILGRPNVGKSTLFNRLIGKRKSIVSPVEGVTRDRIYGTFTWLDKEYKLIDTGGYIHNSDEVIDVQVNKQAELATSASDLIIFMVDGKSEITSNDRVLGNTIKKSGIPSILIVNKIDEIDNDENMYDYYELGFDKIVSLSAQSGRQVGILLDEIDKINFNISSFLDNDKDCISLAIVGMPYVGKSSLMNNLMKENKSIVTDIAGTTRDSIDSYINYFGKTIRVIDTAGLRKKSKMDDEIEFYSSLRAVQSIDECNVAAVMIDVNKGFSSQDKNIIKYVIDKGKGLMLVLNKWDLIEKDTYTMKEITDDVIYEYPLLQFYPILFTSVKHNLRLGNILEKTLKISENSYKKYTTKDLNDFLKKVLSIKRPPSVKGKDIKIKYITQVHVSPPVFVFFTTYPELITESYRRFLLNQLRANFDFEGVTIKVSFRTNK